MAGLYSLSQLVDKTFFGVKDIECKRIATDSAPIWYIVKKGQPLGKLYSWVNPNAQRDSIWLMFNDAYGKPFYVKMETGKFSLSKLIQQGAISVKEQIELEKQKEEEPKDGFDKTKEIINIGLTGVAIWGAVTIFKTLKSNGN